MLQNWLKPLSAASVSLIASLKADQLGAKLQLHQADVPNLRKVRVAFLGVEPKEADAVRAALYPLTALFPAGTVADLGNLRKPDAGLLIPVLYELLSGRIIPIVLSTRHELARAQFLAYQETKALVNLAVIDSRPRFDLTKEGTDVYTPLFQPRHPLLFHAGVVGLQAHFTAPAVLDWLSQQNFDVLRLGKSRMNLEETEPFLRDADLLAFHLSALKQSEAPGAMGTSPSGYTVEEACQLCRYAGMSDKLTSLGLYGFRPEADRDQQTAQVIAQLIWYFLDGVFQRKNDYPASKDGLTEYIVEFRQYNYQLTFWKSTRSGRWWIQVPTTTKRKHQRHHLIPCSYQDYQAACREDLPERLLEAFKRFG
jgi:formiminoglutamase